MVVLWGGISGACRMQLDCPVLAFDDVLQRGRDGATAFSPPPLRHDDTATLVGGLRWLLSSSLSPSSVCL